MPPHPFGPRATRSKGVLALIHDAEVVPLEGDSSVEDLVARTFDCSAGRCAPALRPLERQTKQTTMQKPTRLLFSSTKIGRRVWTKPRRSSSPDFRYMVRTGPDRSGLVRT